MRQSRKMLIVVVGLCLVNCNSTDSEATKDLMDAHVADRVQSEDTRVQGEDTRPASDLVVLDLPRTEASPPVDTEDRSQDLGETASPPDQDPFTNLDRWSAFDAGNTDGLETGGYFGVIFDGQYVYHAPCRLGNDFHARALRYDTQNQFDAPASWEAYDAAGTDGLITVGYAGGTYDGRYVYYAPFTHSESRHAQVLRYDTQTDFKAAEAWTAYDANSVGGLKAMGFVEAAFDGRYVYFSPFGYKPFAHGRVLRLDTQGDFKAAESWSLYEAGNTDGLVTKGYYGLILAEQYLYFVPFNDGIEFHGRVLRFDTTADFNEATSWSAYDAGNTSGLDTRGYKMAAYDGRHVYFVPFRTSTEEAHGRVLRYDTQTPFSSPASWEAFDAGTTDGHNATAYVGAAFDGTHVYFCPYSYSAVDYHSIALRYTTTLDFGSQEAWTAFKADPIDGLTTKGYKGIVFDGRYIHFTPYHDGTALRFDALGE